MESVRQSRGGDNHNFMTATQENERNQAPALSVSQRLLEPAEGDPIAANLEHLAQYIRRTLPLPDAIVHMEINVWQGVVQFSWEARKFVVTPSLETFELKGHNLFVTAASILVQAVLAKQKKTARIVSEVLDALDKVDELLQAPRIEPAVTIIYLSDGYRSMRTLFAPRIDAALELLDSLKQTIRRQLRSRGYRH
jgi:hypothetical protein